MVSYWMEPLESSDSAIQVEKMIPGGFFDRVELMALSLLIRHRPSHPLYFGDCWRCYLCTFECFDFFDMVDHVLQTHDPKPFSDADVAELNE